MSQGYLSVQGYTGHPSNPTPPRASPTPARQSSFDWADAKTIGGKVLTAVGMYMAADAQAQGYEAAAHAALAQLKQHKKEARYTVWRQQVIANSMLDEQVSTFAAAGVESTSGGALDFTMGQLRELRMQQRVGESGARFKSKQLKQQARDYKHMASQTRTAGAIGAIGSLL